MDRIDTLMKTIFSIARNRGIPNIFCVSRTTAIIAVMQGNEYIINVDVTPEHNKLPDRCAITLIDASDVFFHDDFIDITIVLRINIVEDNGVATYYATLRVKANKSELQKRGIDFTEERHKAVVERVLDTLYDIIFYLAI